MPCLRVAHKLQYQQGLFFANSPNSTTVFDTHVDNAKPGLPFFVFCPVVPMLLDGCALLQLAMVCRTARDSTRNLSTVLQAPRREILQVAKYLDLASLRFPGFGRMDVMHLYHVSFKDNRAWHRGEDPYLSIMDSHSAGVQRPIEGFPMYEPAPARRHCF